MSLSTDQLDNLRGVFANARSQHGKLDDFIMDLQGTGNAAINLIVNDLVFLKRELMRSYPDRNASKDLLIKIHKRASKVLQKPTPVSKTLTTLCDTITSIK